MLYECEYSKNEEIKNKYVLDKIFSKTSSILLEMS